MSVRVLYVAATETEAKIPELMKFLDYAGRSKDGRTPEVAILVTGIGSINTIWMLKQWLSENPRPDLVINGGIAGSYRSSIGIGEVVMPVSDCFADSGIEERDGFMTLFEAGLADPDKHPFKSGFINAEIQLPERIGDIFRPVKAITVNAATGTEVTIQKLVRKFDPDIETMEGAAIFYVCRMESLPFLALRAISNIVEPRKKENWKTGLALRNLGRAVGDIIEKLTRL